jgi:hypothetical protein
MSGFIYQEISGEETLENYPAHEEVIVPPSDQLTLTSLRVSFRQEVIVQIAAVLKQLSTSQLSIISSFAAETTKRPTFVEVAQLLSVGMASVIGQDKSNAETIDRIFEQFSSQSEKASLCADITDARHKFMLKSCQRELFSGWKRATTASHKRKITLKLLLSKYSDRRLAAKQLHDKLDIWRDAVRPS